MMRKKTIDTLTALLVKKDNRTIVEWAESPEGIDYSRCPSYDCSYRKQFNISLLPFWKEPLNNISNRSIKQIVILKCCRAGGSMTILETALRHAIAIDPKPCLYVTGSRENAESFFKHRICKGMKLSPMTQAKYSKGLVSDLSINFDDMRFECTFPGATMFGKQSSFSLILADEVSTYSDTDSIAALRTRTVTNPFSKLVLISSPDANQNRNSKDDPIFIAYDQTDQREYFCADPITGNLFLWKMGSAKGNEAGLKWDIEAKNKDGSWNYNTVRKSAYYLTESGTKIYNKDKQAIVATGKWISTVKDKDSIDAGKIGYHTNCFLMPWFSLGDIAVAFLEATETSKKDLRAFIFNYLAEPYWESKVEIKNHQILLDRQGNYEKKQDVMLINEYKNKYAPLIEVWKIKNPKGRTPLNIVTVDVQKDVLYLCNRLWFFNGDSFLIDWKKILGFSELIEYVNEIKPSWVGVDCNYQNRKLEAMDVCFKERMIPMIGSKELVKDKIQIRDVNPYEGHHLQLQNKKIAQITFDSSYFKQILFELYNNTRFNRWFLYNGIEQVYLNMLMAEKYVDGRWLEKSAMNHAIDLETMSLTIAYHLGYLTPSVGQ